MKTFTQLTVTERAEMQTRWTEINANWLKLVDMKIEISEQDRDFMNSVSYQMFKKKVLSDKQMTVAETIVSKYAARVLRERQTNAV